MTEENITPTPKHQSIDAMLTGLTGKDRSTTIAARLCMTCDGPADTFRTPQDLAEYRISGMCQKCQDEVFGQAEEDEITFSPLEEGLLSRITNAPPSYIMDMMEGYPSAILAGGFCRDTLAGLPPRDIDIFWNKNGGPVPQQLSTLTKLYPMLQITAKVFNDPEDLISNFDLTCCQLAVWFEDGKWLGLVGSDTLGDIGVRQLNLASPTMWNGSAGTFQRILRLLQRGWTITDSTIYEMLASVYGVMTIEGVDAMMRGTTYHGNDLTPPIIS